MKQRLTTAAIALIVLFVAMLFFETPVFNLFIGIVSALAVYELLYQTQYVTSKLVLVVSVAFALFFPMLYLKPFKHYLIAMAAFYLVFLGAMFLMRHEKYMLPSICTAFLVTLLVPVVFSVSIILRDRLYPDGIFYYVLALGGGWFADSGGYFIGSLFGKHKMAPKISPKKTVEGAVGGIVATILGYLLIGLLYTLYRSCMGEAIHVSYLMLAFAAPVCAVAGILGDLFASVIKRQTGIKDYGNILPGHGGIMDRFDSVLFVSPVLYVFISFASFVTR